MRENYARADEPGVAIVFELDSVEQARRYSDDFRSRGPGSSSGSSSRS